ncbi:hypothetical protein [Alteribacter natronophilus]|uniref:hypothetical protein n=1 Tax=Alteribacter natronophilus TaxID=2583810 RepID=UPI00110D96FF|nr:hypothetical protein [Alteribacter natronophilus]TMW71591.1 hypothetical protein FGB90_11190 [Alteribacter natronophilus]
MDKKNVITIRMNGEKKLIFRDEDDSGSVQSEEAASEKNRDEPEVFHWVLAAEEPPGSDHTADQGNVVDFGKHHKEKSILRKPFWDDGNRDGSPKLPPVKRKKKRPVRRKFVLPELQLPGRMLAVVMSAIIVGTGFGLMLYTIFTTGEGDYASSAAAPAAEEASGGEMDGGSIEASAPVGSVTDDEFTGGVPNLTVHVVQGGAFSTAEKGSEAVRSMRTEGYPAVLTGNTDPSFMFIGIAPNKGAGDDIAAAYTQAGYDTYPKVFSVSGENVSVDEETAAYLYAGTQLVDELLGFGAAFTLNGTEVPDADLAAMADQWYEWKEKLADLDGESASVQEAAALWTAKTGEAVEQLQHNGVTGWDLQHRLLESVLLYEELVGALKES